MSPAIHSVPRATMRLQLHKDFTFQDATEKLPYIASLGISHVYTSPILTARPGSIHGYDVIDPTQVNPELGGEDSFRRFVVALRGFGLGLIVDIVPNHMAVGASENPWWSDVLKHGRASRFAGFFDIDWDSAQPGLQGKVLAPFLGKPYGQALADGDIRLRRTGRGEPVVDYLGNEFPINPADYAQLHDPEAFDPAHPAGRNLLHALLERQHYRLAWWTAAGDEINWRRFFDINGLAGLRIEVPEVFEETHATLFRLYAEGLIDGFRVDHVDGLSDPPAYCRRLRRRLDELRTETAQARAYIVIEKILAQGEVLPEDWGVDGTTGYDFMNEVSALQHDQSADPTLLDVWRTHSHRTATFTTEEVSARLDILQRNFHAPLAAVASSLHDLAWSDLVTRDVTMPAILRGLTALISHFPVYRGYNTGGARSVPDQAVFQSALDGARQDIPESAHSVLDHIEAWLGGEAETPGTVEGRRKAARLFYQLTAPIAAKAVEDTVFYRYGRLLSRNDVGFDAVRLGSSVDDFHAECRQRLESFPNAMLATATHDHKRGEDVRARLAVISEIPKEWASFVSQALSLPASERPDPGDEMMLYQSIIGAWPLDLDVADDAAVQQFAERLSGWQEKALREAKLRTDWVAPNAEYEAKAEALLFEVLSTNSAHRSLLQSFVARIAAAGALNGLAQATLKLTVPGLPDFFQGTEFWDFSLVDPDNRRPVDFGARQSALDGDSNLTTTWRDGRVKQHLIRTLLALRNERPALFAQGDYQPLTVHGALSNHIVAFARTYHGETVVVIVPRLPLPLMRSTDSLMLDVHDLSIDLAPPLAGRRFLNVMAGGSPTPLRQSQPLAPLLDRFPIAVLRSW
jgi:(1->4)-alpha-D-glucan 1-alpha-D-glucosylmutase